MFSLSPRKSLNLRGEFFICSFFLLVSMLVFKHSFGKGNKKRKGKNGKLKATAVIQLGHRCATVVAKWSPSPKRTCSTFGIKRKTIAYHQASDC